MGEIAQGHVPTARCVDEAVDGSGHHHGAARFDEDIPGNPPELKRFDRALQQHMGGLVGRRRAEHRQRPLEAQACVALGRRLVDGFGVGLAEVEQGVGFFVAAVLAQRVDFFEKPEIRFFFLVAGELAGLFVGTGLRFEQQPFQKGVEQFGLGRGRFQRAILKSLGAPFELLPQEQGVQHLEAFVDAGNRFIVFQRKRNDPPQHEDFGAQQVAFQAFHAPSDAGFEECVLDVDGLIGRAQQHRAGIELSAPFFPVADVGRHLLADRARIGIRHQPEVGFMVAPRHDFLVFQGRGGQRHDRAVAIGPGQRQGFHVPPALAELGADEVHVGAGPAVNDLIEVAGAGEKSVAARQQMFQHRVACRVHVLELVDDRDAIGGQRNPHVLALQQAGEVVGRIELGAPARPDAVSGPLPLQVAVEQKNAFRDTQQFGALFDGFAVLQFRPYHARLDLSGDGQEFEDLFVVFRQPEFARRTTLGVFVLKLGDGAAHVGRNGLAGRQKGRLDAFEVAQHLLGEGVEGDAANAAGGLFVEADFDQPCLQHARRFDGEGQRDDALGPYAPGDRFCDAQGQCRGLGGAGVRHCNEVAGAAGLNGDLFVGGHDAHRNELGRRRRCLRSRGFCHA